MSCLKYAMLTVLCFVSGLAWSADGVVDLGNKRDLFIDDHLIAQMENVELLVHQPQRKELTFIFNKPWESDGQNYFTVFKDEKKYRMTYHAWGQFPARPLSIAYAESDDGIHWVRPSLGICEFNGNKDNNIILTQVAQDVGCHDFNPFLDTKPGVKPEAKYKAIGWGWCTKDNKRQGLYVWQSPDAVHWTLIQDKPVYQSGAFDTQNVTFWSEMENCYVLYYRDYINNIRVISKAVSPDLINWTKKGEIVFPEGQGPRIDAQFYTNQILPYYRAPQLYIGFPARYVDHGITASTKLLPEWEARQNRIKLEQRLGTTVTDSVFISSRDGFNFNQSNDAFVQPGLRTAHNWSYGDNYLSWNVVETASVDDDSPRELSIYSVESYQTGGESRLRRYSFRIDGFSSLHAKSKSGTVTTKPIRFEGKELSLNAATSAAGFIRVEVLKADGSVIPGFSANDCDMIYGDSLDRRVTWKGNADMSSLAKEPVVLKFILCEADVYSLKWEK